MPELAEVEYYRRRWSGGVGGKIVGVDLHAGKRIFRGVDTAVLSRALVGARLVSSQAHGKQMLFRFSGWTWLGIHLGMSGELRVEPRGFVPGKHDHLVLRKRARSLVFSDPRQFGRVLVHYGRSEPNWWAKLPPALTSEKFTVELMGRFLQRHYQAPLKAVLLRQDGFPGIGNWMADEILWRARIHPRAKARRLGPIPLRLLWRTTRAVCAAALKKVAVDYSSPPRSWLFQHRWEPGGRCPRDGVLLGRATIGGRTTVWCPQCQG